MFFGVYLIKTDNPGLFGLGLFRCGWAADYFPTVSRSIIAAAGLNFSVRDGKRCAPALVPPLGLPATGAPGGSATGIPRGGTSKRSHTTPQRILGAARQAFGPLVPLGSTSRNAHTCGLSTWSSPTALQGGLISGRASRLDAFSAYPVRTRLPGSAPGGATGSP